MAREKREKVIAAIEHLGGEKASFEGVEKLVKTKYGINLTRSTFYLAMKDWKTLRASGQIPGMQTADETEDAFPALATAPPNPAPEVAAPTPASAQVPVKKQLDELFEIIDTAKQFLEMV